MKIFIVRHGETVWNTEGRFQGQIDTQLNSNGEQQAEAVAERLKDIKFSKIICSHLQRARYTAELIKEKSETEELIIDDRIIEINHGEWEGCLASEINAKWPGMLDTWHNFPEKVIMPGKGGESLYDIQKRIKPFICNIASDTSGNENIVIVSHDAVIKVLLCEILDAPLSSFWKFQIPNCSISVIEKTMDNKFRLTLLSDTNHLGISFNRSEQKGL